MPCRFPASQAVGGWVVCPGLDSAAAYRADAPMRPSGLLGPVELLSENR